MKQSNKQTRIVLLGFDPQSSIEFTPEYCSQFSIMIVDTVPWPHNCSSIERKSLRDRLRQTRPHVAVIRCHALNGDLARMASYLREGNNLQLIAIVNRGCSRAEAQAAGFFDVAVYPAANHHKSWADFRMKLVLMIRNAKLSGYVASLGYTGSWTLFPNAVKDAVAAKSVELVAIGASAGGTEAITEVVKHLPVNFTCVLVVQHMPRDFTALFASGLNKKCAVNVKEAQNGDPVQNNMIYIAPGDKQMAVERTMNGLIVRVYNGEKVSGHRPSVDVLFKSVAQAVGEAAIGVILTGMGADGAAGLLEMRRAGAYTIGQDQNSSVVYGMPEVAFASGAVAIQLPLNCIADEIINKISGQRF